MHLLLPRSSITFSYVDCTYLDSIVSHNFFNTWHQSRNITGLDWYLVVGVQWLEDTYCSFRCKTSNWTDVVRRNNCYVIIGISLMYLPTGGKTEKSTPSINKSLISNKDLIRSIAPISESSLAAYQFLMICVRFAASSYPFWRIHCSTSSQKFVLALGTLCLSIKSSTKGIFKIVSFDLAQAFQASDETPHTPVVQVRTRKWVKLWEQSIPFVNKAPDISWYSG